MKIRDVMNVNATRIVDTATLREAAEVISRSQVSDLMVVDAGGKFAGVLSEGDLIRAIMPDYEEMLRDQMKLSQSWKIFLENGARKRGDSISDLVIKEPITVAPDDQILSAAATMVSKQIRRLPVVEDGRLVGTVARADICRGVLAG
jgi:CBS domain-containing protein